MHKVNSEQLLEFFKIVEWAKDKEGFSMTYTLYDSTHSFFVCDLNRDGAGLFASTSEEVFNYFEKLEGVKTCETLEEQKSETS